MLHGETYEKVWFCEKVISSYESHMLKGYFMFKLAGLLIVQGAGFVAMERYREVGYIVLLHVPLLIETSIRLKSSYY